jgi:hypothetical protein
VILRCVSCIRVSPGAALVLLNKKKHLPWQVRHKKKTEGHEEEIWEREVLLRHGDLMTMEGHFQKHYLHSVWPVLTGNHTPAQHPNQPFPQTQHCHGYTRTCKNYTHTRVCVRAQ